MPYGRRKVHHQHRRRRAAGTLQRAWRRAKTTKKKSALVRQTEANRKAIKDLRETREVKFCRQMVAKSSNNYIGQLLSPTVVDNFGLTMDSETWVTAAGAAFLPTVQAPSYQPLWVCATGIQTTGGISQGVTAQQRIGDDVIMRSLNIKGSMIGGKSADNGGIYQNCPHRQYLHMFAILDKNPCPENRSNPAAYNVNYTPAQTFTYQPTWNNSLPGGFSTDTFRGVADHLKSVVNGSKNPSGLATTLAHKDLLNLSYWSKDEGGISEGDRFKLLKHYKYSCSQQMPEAASLDVTTSAVATKAQHDFSETIKGNYKFSFRDSKSAIPDNQRIYLVFCSETPTVRYGAAVGQAPVDYITAPKVTLTCSFNYVDP